MLAFWPWEAAGGAALACRLAKTTHPKQVVQCHPSSQRNSSAHSFLLPSGWEMILGACGMLLLAPHGNAEASPSPCAPATNTDHGTEQNNKVVAQVEISLQAEDAAGFAKLILGRRM